MTDEQNAILTAFLEALSAYDADKVRTLVTAEATLMQPTRPAYTGPDGAEQMVNDLARNYTEFTVEPQRTIAGSDSAAVEWLATITDFGGGQSRVDGCTVAEFEGGLIRRLQSYWRPEDTHS